MSKQLPILTMLGRKDQNWRITSFVLVCKVASENDAVKVVVIKGAGPGWSSGGDISMLAAIKDPISAKETYDRAGDLVMDWFANWPVPIWAEPLTTLLNCMELPKNTMSWHFSAIRGQ